ncbi:MAG TPA: Fe-S-containing protein [Candidatus Bathyarchaeia archaeon]|nr:Fe-S-containing protein [Candidatus Bathyarchaeia archaeon]
MIEALIITLREGLEAALVLGLILVYLKKVGRANLRKFAYIGLFLAIIASGIGAYTFQALSLGEEIADTIEAYVMLTAAFFVGTMVIWMFKTAKNFKKQIEQRVDTITSKKSNMAQGLGLMLLAFTMVFREGAEIILLIAGLSFSIGSNPFLIVSGGLLGLGIAALLGILIIKGLVRINLRLFFAGTGAVLIALIATLVANALHNFAEFNVISLSPAVLSFLGYLVRDDTSMLILVALLAVPTILFIIDPILKSRKTLVSKDESPVKRRLRIAETKRTKVLRTLMGLLLLTVILSFGFSAIASADGYNPEVVPVFAQNGNVTLLRSEFSDNLMHKYSIEVQGVPVRFFVIENSVGEVKVALDACYICPPAGYFQETPGGEIIVCHNCDAPINWDSIGLSGGCNPRILKFAVDESQVVINQTELEASVKYFVEENWEPVDTGAGVK